MRVLTAIHDPVFVPRLYSRFDQFLLRFIKDERDLPFVHLCLRITLTLIPLSILLYMPFVTGWVWWAVAGVHFFLNNVAFKGPYGLMLHCTCHRPLFRKEYDFMNNYIPWVLAPFFGQTPETYFSHHIGMHHAENNQEDDDSSTMAYRRDSLRGFLRYFLDFLLTGLHGLMSYLNRKKRRKLATRAFVGEITFFTVCLILAFVNWRATVAVFILPFFIFRFVTMLGNWTQHAFIDPTDPGNPYKNSITCINVKYNRKCWNDGYHISHHERPAMHWTEHPAYFQKTLPKYVANKALIFDGIGYPTVFFCLMTKKYDVLARHVVNLDGTFANEQEIVRLLQQRTQPVRQAQSQPAFA